MTKESDRNMEIQKLTPMHWALYRFIEKRTLGTSETVSQKEVYEHLKNEGYDVTWNESQNQHNDHCRWLWNLVNDIKFSLEVDHVIVHDKDYNYSLGDRYEVLREWWQFRERSRLAKEREVALLGKIKQDGQYKLLSNQGEPITEESLAKLYHETFNEKGKRKHAKNEVPSIP